MSNVITKVEGFILSTVNYRESSLVINLFTKEYGIIGILAKGVKSIKSPLRALCMKYTYGFFYIYYKENKLSILTDVDIIDNFKNIHSDIVTISFLAYICDLTNQVYKNSENIEIYDLFIKTIYKLNEGIDPLVLTNILETKYLNYLGVGINLDSCLNCGNTKNIVTIIDGGLLCKDCYRNEPIKDLKIIKLLRMYELIEISSITNINIKDYLKEEINEFLDDYYERYTGLYIKSKQFLNKLKDSMNE